jgi:hypothetical protein
VAELLIIVFRVDRGIEPVRNQWRPNEGNVIELLVGGRVFKKRIIGESSSVRGMNRKSVGRHEKER